MTVDTYATCPCGNGKKIKFCKCKDSVHQMDEVMTMIEGGQVVPALDRLARILEENPEAAWALAIRGRILLDVREYDSLAENADRFIRLQPSNPLALTQRSAASLFSGEAEKATGEMLRALVESGRDVDSFVLDVASVLAHSLAQAGVFLTARVYATLAMMATDYEGGQTALQVLRNINSSPKVNLLLKQVPEPLPRPADADWGERYDEAANLLRNNKVALAESKFESLRRSVPDAPAILSGLLTCAIWRGDTESQADLLKKLSDCETLDFETRVRYLAMSLIVDPAMPSASVKTVELTAELDSIDEAVMAMNADSRFVPLPPDVMEMLRQKEGDAPPRAGFQILDRDKPDSLTQLPSVDEIPESIGMVLVYGRETDRAARIETLGVREGGVDDVKTQLAKASADLDWTLSDGPAMPLTSAIEPEIAMIRFQTDQQAAETMQSELAQSRLPVRATQTPLDVLGGRSLADLRDDESALLQRTAVMRIFEFDDTIGGRDERLIATMHELAGLQPQPPLTPGDGEIESIDNVDLNRVDVGGLNSESIVYLLQRAQQISATPAVRRAAESVVGRDSEDPQVRMIAYMSLINTTSDKARALQLMDEAKAFAKTNDLSMPALLLAEVSLRLAAGDGEGFQSAIGELTSRHGNDPEVMARLQQMLISYGLLRPDGSPAQGPPAATPGPATTGGAATASPAAGSAGGLWTPDGGSSGTPPSGPASGGGGKIIIPGMD